MQKILSLSLILFLTLFASCHKDHLYVQQEWIDRNFLASSRVGTPDPRQEDPPEGQRLLISWKFSPKLIDQGLTLVTTVRFWDNAEECICRPMKSSWGYEALFFPKQKILTYQIQVVNGCDEIVETWKHQFWTESIDLDRKSVSVSSQSRQGSVIETP
jgi:hypothetical protein